MSRFVTALKPVLPPRFSMDEYVDFVEISLRAVAPARAARQKKLEERIMVPFRLAGEKVLKRNRRQPS